MFQLCIVTPSLAKMEQHAWKGTIHSPVSVQMDTQDTTVIYVSY